MRDPERVRRSNRLLIVIVILMLLYGIINRMQSGNDSIYLFGYKIYGTEQTSETAPEQEETK